MRGMKGYHLHSPAALRYNDAFPKTIDINVEFELVRSSIFFEYVIFWIRQNNPKERKMIALHAQLAIEDNKNCPVVVARYREMLEDEPNTSESEIFYLVIVKGIPVSKLSNQGLSLRLFYRWLENDRPRQSPIFSIPIGEITRIIAAYNVTSHVQLEELFEALSATHSCAIFPFTHKLRNRLINFGDRFEDILTESLLIGTWRYVRMIGSEVDEFVYIFIKPNPIYATEIQDLQMSYLFGDMHFADYKDIYVFAPSPGALSEFLKSFEHLFNTHRPFSFYDPDFGTNVRYHNPVFLD